MNLPAASALLMVGLLGCPSPDMEEAIPDSRLKQPLSGKILRGNDALKVSSDARVVAERVLNMATECEVSTDPNTGISDIECDDPSPAKLLPYEMKDKERAVSFRYPLCRLTVLGDTRLVVVCAFDHRTHGVSRHTLSFRGDVMCLDIEQEETSATPVRCARSFGDLPSDLHERQAERFFADTRQLSELKPELAQIGR